MKTFRFLPPLAALREAGSQWLRRVRPAPPPPDPFAPPTDLRFELGCFPFSRLVIYRVRKGWIERTDRLPAWPRAAPALHRRQPTAEDWRDFWKTIAPLRIWAWQPMYFTPPSGKPFVLDGASWRFSCRCGSRRMKSHGGRYYPTLGCPHETDSRCESISLLQTALDTLLSPDPGDRAADRRDLAARLRPRRNPQLREGHDTVPDQ